MMDDSTPKSSRIYLESSISKKFEILKLVDPRSPTNLFQRTPIQVIIDNFTSPTKNEFTNNENVTTVDELNNNSTVAQFSSPCFSISPTSSDGHYSSDISISNSSFMSTDNSMDIDNISPCDASVNVSDFSLTHDDNVLEKFTRLTKNAENFKEETIVSSDISNSKKVGITDSLECNNVNKTPFNLSVEMKKTATKKLLYSAEKKVRNPLESVNNICPVTPPHFVYGSLQNVVHQKHWKRIQEERKKLGLELDENIPLPLYDVTASAPSKLTLYKKKANDKFKIFS